MQKISRKIATLFFIGYIPFLPGTLASILGVLAYLLVGNNTPLYLTLTVFLLALGFWSASCAEKTFNRKDPPEIVIDEFSATLLVYLFIPFRAKFILIGFVLFRIFDIFKLPPVKKLQVFPAGYGIMLDDIAAAILANIVLQVLRFLPTPF